jgi:glycosyltransferase involved in cell wall biosynthesis
MDKVDKHIAIVCNYALRPDRVGGMDRFFVGYDAFAKANFYKITWYFSSYEPFAFYENLTIKHAAGSNVEHFFLSDLEQKADRYDILITHFTSLCSSFYKKARSLNNFEKVIVVDHNPRPLLGFSLKKRIKNRIKGFLYHHYVNQFIGVSDYTSKNIIADLGHQVKNKTQTIYNGIDTSIAVYEDRDRQRAFTEKDPLQLIIVSHLRESKGIQDAIQAVNNLDPRLRRKLHIDIYGNGPMEEELRDMVNKYCLNSLITFSGSSANIPKILPQYDYLLQPTYMECFSLSILESLAANVAVITTTVGGNTEIIKDEENGFLFEARMIKQLERILKEIITGKLSILKSTRGKIEDQFPLQKMIADHFKLVT